MSVQITINDQALVVDKGITILQAARLNHIIIPTLCDYPSLPAHGSCRLCVVEIQGKANTPTACSTPVEDGMVIFTHSPKIQALRGELFQMLLAEHPTYCLFCPEKTNCGECMVTVRKAGVTTGCRSCTNDRQCEIQDLAEALNLTQVNYPIRYRMLKPVHSDPFIDHDYNLCVMCGRCVRICQTRHFSNPVGFLKRGSDITVDTASGKSLQGAGCRFCGACVDVCPTGALSEKARKWLGKPNRQTRTTCPFCSIGCPMDILSRDNLALAGIPVQSSPDGGHLCVLGRFSIPEMVNHPNRLRSPIKTAGKDRVRISWEDALEQAVELLAACPPSKFSMVVSAGCTNEDLYVAHKFTRSVMMSNHITTGVSSSYPEGFQGVIQWLGSAPSLGALTAASTILCLGMDDRYVPSVVESGLYRARSAGARVISVSPQPYSLVDFADVCLQPEPGQEAEVLRQLALYTSMMTSGQEGGMRDDHLRGVLPSIEKAASLLQEPGIKVIIAGPSCLTHPDNSRIFEAVQDLQKTTSAKVITLPLEGNLVGSLLMESIPWDTCGPLPAQQDCSLNLDGSPQVMYAIGGVPPNSRNAQDVIIYQNIIAPPAGLEPDLILPAAAFSEASGTTVNYEGRVRLAAQAIPPIGEALPTWQILCRIAQIMNAPGFDFSGIEEIQAEIRGFVPDFAIDRVVDCSSLIGTTDYLSMTPNQADGEPQGASPAASLEPMYMGFPIGEWVEGLRSLYPVPAAGALQPQAEGAIPSQKMGVSGNPG